MLPLISQCSMMLRWPEVELHGPIDLEADRAKSRTGCSHERLGIECDAMRRPSDAKTNFAGGCCTSSVRIGQWRSA
jgi:hypothetical protein